MAFQIRADELNEQTDYVYNEQNGTLTAILRKAIMVSGDIKVQLINGSVIEYRPEDKVNIGRMINPFGYYRAGTE